MKDELTEEDFANMLGRTDVQEKLHGLFPIVSAASMTTVPRSDRQLAFSIIIVSDDAEKDGAILEIEVDDRQIPVVVRVAKRAAEFQPAQIAGVEVPMRVWRNPSTGVVVAFMRRTPSVSA